MSLDFTGWSNYATDPYDHNENDFQYLVHSVLHPIVRWEQQLNIRMSWLDSSFDNVNLIKNPEDIWEKLIVSASLINSEHTGTWANTWYIINFEEDGLISADRNDMWVHGSSIEEIKKKYNKILPPSDITASKSHTIYNEVVLEGSKTNIKGVFSKCYEDGQPLDPKMHEEMKKNADKLSIPFIIISVKKPILNDHGLELDLDSEWGLRSFSIVKDSKKYQYSGESGWYIYDFQGKVSEMKEMDIDYLISLIDEGWELDSIEKYIWPIKKTFQEWLENNWEEKISWFWDSGVNITLEDFIFHLNPEFNSYRITNREELQESVSEAVSMAWQMVKTRTSSHTRNINKDDIQKLYQEIEESPLNKSTKEKVLEYLDNTDLPGSSVTDNDLIF